MNLKRKPSLVQFLAGASVAAMGASAPLAMAQDATAGDETSDEISQDEGDVIIVSGIRASLQDAMNIKRNAVGVVDAISAEDIGKFPDTNLAESLQRITGVSIDRQNGEGSRVTVRGFGPDFNLVLLNGRQMPASTLGDCCSAPASRSFDFANLASEGVAGVEVYKSGRSSLPTGGIGSVINIKTPRPLDRPGFQGSIGVKGVLDYTFEDTKITPEVSGIISKTFADDTIGVLVTGSYQRRKASLSQFSVGEWREGYLATEGNWGSLAMPGDPRFDNIENRPEGDDIYQVPQNAAYDFTDIDRERINGQAVLQFQPSDQFTATLDYTFSQNTIDARTSSIGVWFNHDQTSSSWTDGPVAGPNFYSEVFAPPEPAVGNNGKDLAITGAVAANRNINHSIGTNLEWNHPSGMRWVLDAHYSTAESKPTSPYGSNVAVGTSIFGVQSQTVDFTTDLPVISVNMYPGSEIDASNIRPSGNAFRNAYMKDRIIEASLRGGYDFDDSFIESLDFGVTFTDNKVRTAYGFLQNETWGGTLSADETPDDFFTPRSTSEDLQGMNGADSPNIIPTYYNIATEQLIDLLESSIGICSDPFVGVPLGEGCLAEYSVDRRLREKTLAPFVQSLHTFDLMADEAHLRLGLRYETTDVKSSALVPIPTGTEQSSENEIAVRYDGGAAGFTTFAGKYNNWLPAVDFDISPINDVVLRASYSHTITRPDYASLNGGLTVNSPARPNGGSTGGSGNPNLLPYKSKNIDLSAEWFYAPASYVSVGYFRKSVSNFIANATTQTTAFGLTNPSQGAVAQAARAALGDDATFAEILAYAAANNPEVVTFDADGDPVGLLGQPGDPELVFTLTQPFNSDQSATLDGFEFAVQHSFWETGFGVILNYTIVKSDTDYDNTLRYTEPQFAVTGVSDSANAVLYYDKGGLQARVAYNWRDEFLSGYGFDPFYVEAYGQVDASASYEFSNGVTIFGEAINLLNEDRRGHRRADQAVYFAAPGHARYTAGLRFTW